MSSAGAHCARCCIAARVDGGEPACSNRAAPGRNELAAEIQARLGAPCPGLVVEEYAKMSVAMPSFALRDLRSDELPTAARLLGQAMRDNPVNVRAFGGNDTDRERSLIRFFGAVLAGARPRASVLGGFRGDELVAVAVLAPPGKCQPTLGEKVSIVPSLVRGNPLSTLGRVLRWTGAWAARDHRDPHWHLGPLAVAAHLQGQGIGKQVMAEVCAWMDERQGLLYLETDKPENVRFYERFGFAIRDEASVLGVPSWFMARALRTHEAPHRIQ